MKTYGIIGALALAFFSCACNKSKKAPLPQEGLAGTANSALAHDPSSIALHNPPKTAPKAADPARTITGIAMDVIDKSGFTYVQLKTNKKELLWIALVDATIKKGQTIAIEEQSSVSNFHSNALNRQFERLIFARIISK